MGAHQQCMMAQKIAAGGSYLNSEDFEGTGTPSGWTAVGSPNFDYTTSPAPLDGAQSLLSSSASNYGYWAPVADFTEMWMYFMFSVSDISGQPYVLRVLDNAGATVIGVRIVTTGAMRITDVTASVATGSAGAYTAGNTKHCWVHIKRAGAGSDICDVFVSDTATKPASASGTDGVNIQTATWDADFRRISTNPGVSVAMIHDKYRISDADIGSNPT